MSRGHKARPFTLATSLLPRSPSTLHHPNLNHNQHGAHPLPFQPLSQTTGSQVHHDHDSYGRHLV